MQNMNTLSGKVDAQNATIKEYGEMPKYKADSPTSIELMAGSKFIGMIPSKESLEMYFRHKLSPYTLCLLVLQEGNVPT